DNLGNLCVIDDKYDVEISIACPALNNIVVDSIEVGQTCIEYLKKKDLDCAMFILLNELPTIVLQNTLVAQNLQQANRIAFTNTRWRVATLNGQLIDKSGTMSGGGNQVFKDDMSSKFSSDIISETISKLENDRSHFEMQWKELNEKIRSL
ncbi:8678_t:CDS:2, partial [Funneliformis caledonium]